MFACYIRMHKLDVVTSILAGLLHTLHGADFDITLVRPSVSPNFQGCEGWRLQLRDFLWADPDLQCAQTTSRGELLRPDNWRGRQGWSPHAAGRLVRAQSALGKWSGLEY